METRQVVTIDPEQELRFQTKDGQLKAYLTISNVSPGNIAYKVKTTAPRFYVVKPNQGILDKNQKITIDITLIAAPENKVEDNKFLVQVAMTELNSSETYALQPFWDKLDKKASISFKLKVSIATGSGSAGASSSSPLGTPRETQASFREAAQKEQQQNQVDKNSRDIPVQPATRVNESVAKTFAQNTPQPQSLQTQVKSNKQEFEKAPEQDKCLISSSDEINQSITQSQNMNQETIKKKYDELKRQFDLIQLDKQRIQTEIRELQNNLVQQEEDIFMKKRHRGVGEGQSHQDNYAWQQPDTKSDYRFQLIHLLITAIICLFIGGYLGAKEKMVEAAVAAGTCDSCAQSFDLEEKIPLLLPQCGCTVCKECAQIIQRDSYCKKCNLPQTIDDFSSLRVNQKIYAFVSLTIPKKEAPKPDQENQSTNVVQPVEMPKPPQKAPLYSFQSHSKVDNNQQLDNQQTSTFKAGFQFFLKQPGSNSRAQSATKRSEVTTQEATDKLTINTSHLPEDKPPSARSHSTQSKFPPQSHPILPKNNLLSDTKKQFCKIHLDKPIEYFCQSCFKTVCSKCMFHHHNGHDLSQIDEAMKTFLKKLKNFDSKVVDVKKEHEELNKILLTNKAEVESMKAKQQAIIDMKFQELILKLEERKLQLAKDLLSKYDNQIFKFNDRIRTCKEQLTDLDNVMKSYNQMIQRLQVKYAKDQLVEAIEILGQVPEYDKMIYENTLKVKNYQLSQKNAKLEAQSGENIALRPVEVGINSALTLIQSLTFDGFGVLGTQTLPSQMQTFFKKKVSSNSMSHSSLPPQPSLPLALQEETKSEQPHSTTTISGGRSGLNTSFNFPKGGLSSSTPTTLSKPPFYQQPPPQLPPQYFQQSQVKFDQVPVQAPPSQPLNDSGSSSTYSSKFARLRFARQTTNNSQELCLQYETTTPVEEEQLAYQGSHLPSSVLELKRVELLPTPSQELSKINISDRDELDQEEIQSQKIKLLDNAIYFIGDTRFILMFDYKGGMWNQLYYDKRESDYQGTLKFMSICQINLKKREFIMTGGCNKITKEPSQQVFRFSIPNIRVFREVQRLKTARYGHASVYINQLVLVFGGFNHKDDESSAPNTLNSCEKYSIKENEWSHIAPMQQERAYFSACRVKEEIIYVFGGFQNYETSNQIESYNIMLDKWTLISILMPLKLAKYGLARVEENQIYIAGGLLVDNASTRSAAENASYSCVNTCYKFDYNTLKWTKLAKLNFRRTMYSNMAVKENGQVFAIGGTIEGINEVYDIRKKKWNTCQSYTQIMGQNDLQTFAVCSLSRINEE